MASDKTSRRPRGHASMMSPLMRSVLLLLLVFLAVGPASAKPDKNSSRKSSASSAERDDDAQRTGKKVTWQPEMDQITCCNGGTPIVPENLVRNFTIIPSDYTIEERTVDDATLNCRDFEVHYLAQHSQILSETDGEFESPIKLRCKCPESTHTLDSNCRRLLNCKNNGFRAPTYPHHCQCPPRFFGNLCEKYCDQGQRLKGHDGRDHCSCLPFYQGEECRDMLCLNGGREVNSRCVCPPGKQYLGYHCEINTNHTGPGSRFQRFGDQSSEMFTRDISGTIFSLLMIVILVVSMYLLMKHRMQTRYLNRRPDLLGACNFPVVPAAVISAGGGGTGGCLNSARRSELITPDDPRFYSFRPVAGLPDSGPPPYFQHRGRRGRDALPPLPTYEDATKLPALRQNIPADEAAANDFIEEQQPTTMTDAMADSARAQSTHTGTNTSTTTSSSADPQQSSSSSGGGTIVAMVRGTEMVRPLEHAADPPSAAALVDESTAETLSIGSTASSASSSTNSSGSASTKPDQQPQQRH